MSETEMGAIVLQMGDLSSERQSWCLFSSKVLWGDLVKQQAKKAAVMCGVSQVEDRAIQNILIYMPILTVMIQRRNRNKM